MNIKKNILLLSVLFFIGAAHAVAPQEMVDDNPIIADTMPASSAYQFTTCYKFQFNKAGLSNNIDYSIVNGRGDVIRSGIINQSQNVIGFCENADFENHTETKVHPDLVTGNVNGINLSEQNSVTKYSILLQNDTQVDSITQTSKIDFNINHQYSFNSNDEGTLLDKAEHSLDINIQPSPNVTILSAQTDDLGKKVMMSTKYFVNRDEDKHILVGLENGHIAPFGWYRYFWDTTLVTPIFLANNDFRPRMMSGSELLTFKVNIDSNPLLLIEPNEHVDKAEFKDIVFDYKNRKGADFLDSNYIVNTDYLGDINSSPFIVDNIDSTPYQCSAFVYDHDSKVIKGYCFNQRDYNKFGTIYAPLEKFTLDLNTCQNNHLKFTDPTHLVCATNK